MGQWTFLAPPPPRVVEGLDWLGNDGGSKHRVDVGSWQIVLQKDFWPRTVQHGFVGNAHAARKS